MKRIFLALVAVFLTGGSQPDPFLVAPYLQNPAPDAMSLLWVSRGPAAGRVSLWSGERPVYQREVGGSRAAESLRYSPWEQQAFGNPHPGYLKEVRMSRLQPDQLYRYEVEQDGQIFQGEFRTAPGPRSPVRLIAYADSETEPESTGNKVQWEDPRSGYPSPGSPRGGKALGDRLYLVDQTEGYAANLRVIQQRRPDLVVIAGDIVESGGEQRDWDEFWRHNRSLASQIPVVGVLGNHEYYGGPNDGQYAESSSQRAVDKYLTYFRSPGNDRSEARERGRYFRLDYGLLTLIAVDGCNGLPHKSTRDSNFHLGSQFRPTGDFNPGSLQYDWLERQLRQAQKSGKFTLVVFHHCPYSSGVHALPPGLDGPRQDPQSGLPLQVLTPLFTRYGVDALLTGHDEMMERSEVPGVEIRPDGSHRPYSLQVYDVGIGGDGLRGPEIYNPLCRFLAHRDSQEIWQDGVLKDGGKHYGHLEIEVSPRASGFEATLTPVYIFPVMTPSGEVEGFERRVYPDIVRISE